MPKKPSAPPAAAKKRRHERRTTDPLLKLVGQHLRDVRKEAGYSQESFASEAGLDRSYWGEVERGRVNIGVLNLIELGRVLHRNPGDLLPGLEALQKIKR